MQRLKLFNPNWRFIHSHSQHNNPTNSTYNNLLQKCINQRNQIKAHNMFDENPQSQISKAAKTIHASSLKLGFSSNGLLANVVIDLYAKCGNVGSAEKACWMLEVNDVWPWNSVLCMYSRRGMVERVFGCFGMVKRLGVWPNEFSFAIVLSACGKLGDVWYGRQVHCQVVRMGYEASQFCEGAVIDMYAKCGCVGDARRAFDGCGDPDTVSWTALISGYVRGGLLEDAVKVFERMEEVGRVPDEVASVAVISACVGLGRLDDAGELFFRMMNPNVVAWNVMISGHGQRGYAIEAIEMFRDMRKADVRPTRSTLGSVLSAIASAMAYECGLQVHALAMKQGLYSNVYVGSSLINMYAKCDELEAARKIFDSLDDHNVVLWNTMLGGYSQNGYANEVLNLFSTMRACGFQPDEFTYTSILSACASLEYLKMGQQFHSVLVQNKLALTLFVGNALVDMYAKSGALAEARQQFELLRTRDNVSWNAIIVGLAKEELNEEAFYMFQKMISSGIVPDEVSMASVLSACANNLAMEPGKQVHCLAVKLGLETSLYAGSSLIDMYAKCGTINAAREILSQMPVRSVASMNALISGCAKYNIEEAIVYFREMLDLGLSPSEITFVGLLDACDKPHKVNMGRQIHCFILKSGISYYDEFLGISILGMYMKSQNVADAEKLFSEFANQKSTVLWTAFISGLTQNDCSEKALLSFREMHNFDNLPDQASYVSVLRACSVSSSLREGQEIHTLIFHTGFNSDELTCSAILDMYAKCGDMQSSVQVFSEMGSKNDVITWNSMIVGFAKNGFAEDALKIFEEMERANVVPDGVSFLGILTACSHAGRVCEGRRVFDVMVNRYGIQPNVDHCACLIDLLGRWGFLGEAEEFIDKLDFEPGAKIWASLLGACKLHGDDVRGRKAAKKLIQLEPQSSSPYILLSSIYAASGNWEEVNTLRRGMRENQVRKYPGCSWIIVGEKTNLFIAGDKSHPMADEMCEVLIYLTALMREQVYVAETDCISHSGGGVEAFVSFG